MQREGSDNGKYSVPEQKDLPTPRQFGGLYVNPKNTKFSFLIQHFQVFFQYP